MTFSCTGIIGLIVFVALMFVSLPALAIVAIGTAAIWFLGRPGKSDKPADEARPQTRTEHYNKLDLEDDVMSVDSGIWSAHDFSAGATKDAPNRPHLQA